MAPFHVRLKMISTKEVKHPRGLVIRIRQMKKLLLLGSFLAMSLGCVHSEETQARMGDSWRDCAETQARKLVAGGVSNTWPTSLALPEGVQVETINLGSAHPEALHDDLVRILHLVPSLNAFYLEQIGGFTGGRQIFGPVSLSDRCSLSR